MATATCKYSTRHRRDFLEFEFLRSIDFDVVQFHKGHENLRDAVGFDNSATIELAKALPLGQRGDTHRALRAEMAKVLAEGRVHLKRALPELVETHFSILNEAGTHDLLVSLVEPFVNEAMAILSGIDLRNHLASCLADIFDSGASIQRRKILEETIKGITEFDTDGSQRVALAINVMGRDPLIGTLAKCLASHFDATRGEPLNSKPFPLVPTDTSVPYVWREDLGAESKPQFLECRIDQFEGQTEDQRLKFFGAGRHTCLGKNHSLMVFDCVAEFIARCDRSALSSEILLTDRHVLHLATKFQTEIGEPRGSPLNR